MYGYIRPHKDEMLVKDFVRYRAMYCGLCKAIGDLAGQISRLTVAYEVTFLAVLVHALRDEPYAVSPEGCFKHVGKPRAMVERDPVMRYMAALTVLLAVHKLDDDLEDREHRLRAGSAKALLRPGAKRCVAAYPELEPLIREHLDRLRDLEQGVTAPDGSLLEACADRFGQLLASLVRAMPEDLMKERPIREAVAMMAYELGRWIYATDALDDYEDDLAEGRFNPLASLAREDAAKAAEALQIACEEALDRTAAILPYRRDAPIISNVMQLGLPRVRQRVAAGLPLEPL